MKHYFFTLFCISISILCHAQNTQSDMSVKDMMEYYYKIAPEQERSKLDSLFNDLVNQCKSIQVKSICGVDFGTSKDDAEVILKNKFGTPLDYSKETVIPFENIKYAGIDFDNVYFLFQSDGNNSFFNSCVFLKQAKNKKQVKEIIETYKTALSRKYTLKEDIATNGFNIYEGGISPLWDGKWQSIIDSASNHEIPIAFHTDVIEYDSDIVNHTGKKYGVRLIYGPFEFVNESF